MWGTASICKGPFDRNMRLACDLAATLELQDEYPFITRDDITSIGCINSTTLAAQTNMHASVSYVIKHMQNVDIKGKKRGGGGGL
jgi:hypothetical protein